MKKIFNQLRLYIAEKMIDIILWIMPKESEEYNDFLLLSAEYMSKRIFNNLLKLSKSGKKFKP